MGKRNRKKVTKKNGKSMKRINLLLFITILVSSVLVLIPSALSIISDQVAAKNNIFSSAKQPSRIKFCHKPDPKEERWEETEDDWSSLYYHEKRGDFRYDDSYDKNEKNTKDDRDKWCNDHAPKNKDDDHKKDQCDSGKPKFGYEDYDSRHKKFHITCLDKKFKKLHYTFTYDTDSSPRGIIGDEELTDDDTFTSQPLLLGSCTTSTCTDDQKVHNIRMKIDLFDTDGKITELDDSQP